MYLVNGSIKGIEGYIKRLIDEIRATLKKNDLKALEVRYEDVVADLEGQVRRMLDFCGLPWEDACLEFHATRRTVNTASAAQVRQPIYRGAVGRWRRYERHLGPLLGALEAG